VKGQGWRLQQLPKLFQTQSRIPDDAAHRECIHWIVARNHQDSRPIRHDNMRALALDMEARFSKAATARR